jgi:FAD synthase
MPDRAIPVRVAVGIQALEAGDGPLFIVVGVFDGIHRGHAYLLRHLVREARRRGARPTVVTFDAHPDEVIAGRAPALLCDPEERLVHLGRAGVEVVVVAHFDDSVRRTPYTGFVEQIASRAKLAGFLMTPDAAFGHERQGTPAALAGLGATFKPPFGVVVVPPYALDGRPVRSEAIRAAIAAGDLAAARRLLGRAVAVTGRLDSGPDGSAIVRFVPPVALPPDDRYRAAIEPAWSLAREPSGPRVRRSVESRDGTIVIHAETPFEVGDRVRIALGDPQQ